MASRNRQQLGGKNNFYAITENFLSKIFAEGCTFFSAPSLIDPEVKYQKRNDSAIDIKEKNSLGVCAYG